jgi:hypothetical protein
MKSESQVQTLIPVNYFTGVDKGNKTKQFVVYTSNIMVILLFIGWMLADPICSMFISVLIVFRLVYH